MTFPMVMVLVEILAKPERRPGWRHLPREAATGKAATTTDGAVGGAQVEVSEATAERVAAAAMPDTFVRAEISNPPEV
jgi:hypothetical protein